MKQAENECHHVWKYQGAVPKKHGKHFERCAICGEMKIVDDWVNSRELYEFRGYYNPRREI